MTPRLLSSIAITMVCLLLVVSLAAADPTIDFSINAPNQSGAVVSYDGTSSGPLIGTGILISNVAGIGTPSNDGVSASCVDCVLTFATGGLSGSTSTQWTFGGGGTVQLVGGVQANGSVIDPAGTTLFTGAWSDASVSQIGGTFKIVGGIFTTFTDASLASFYGTLGGNPGPSWNGALSLSFSADGSSPGALTSTTVGGGDAQVSDPPVSTPEPATFLLLGSGLAGLGFLARFRRQEAR